MITSRSLPTLPASLAVAGLLFVAGVALVIFGTLARRAVPVATIPNARQTAAARPAVARPAVPGARPRVTPRRTRATPIASPAPRIARSPVALGADQFTYEGRWEIVRGMHDGRFAGMSARSFAPGSRLSIAFAGRGIRLYGVDGPGGGTGTVALDGVVVDSGVPFRAPFKRTHALVFTSGPLAQGRHRLTVTVNPGGGPHGGRGYVNVDSAAYDP